MVAAYRTIFKLSHALREGKELDISVGSILVTLQMTTTKTNRKKEIATVYYSKESCIVILNFNGDVHEYLKVLLLENSKSIVLKYIPPNLRVLYK